MSVASMLVGKPKNIIKVQPDDSVMDAVGLLTKHRIGAVIVCDENDGVKGILSERDIVRDIAREGPSVLNGPVSKCMTNKVISCRSTDSVDRVMELMTDNRFRHLPVIDSGNLMGIISIGDVVKSKIEQAEKDAQDMRDYIAG